VTGRGDLDLLFRQADRLGRHTAELLRHEDGEGGVDHGGLQLVQHRVPIPLREQDLEPAEFSDVRPPPAVVELPLGGEGSPGVGLPAGVVDVCVRAQFEVPLPEFHHEDVGRVVRVGQVEPDAEDRRPGGPGHLHLLLCGGDAVGRHPEVGVRRHRERHGRRDRELAGRGGLGRRRNFLGPDDDGRRRLRLVEVPVPPARARGEKGEGCEKQGLHGFLRSLPLSNGVPPARENHKMHAFNTLRKPGRARAT